MARPSKYINSNPNFGKLDKGQASFLGSDVVSRLGAYDIHRGGGEKIDRDHKWHGEKRVDQPINSKGQFTYNAVIGQGRKEPYHGVGKVGGGINYDRAQTPEAMEGMNYDFYKKGSEFVTTDGKRKILVDTVKANEIKRALMYFDPKTHTFGDEDSIGSDMTKNRLFVGITDSKPKGQYAEGQYGPTGYKMRNVDSYMRSSKNLSKAFFSKREAYRARRKIVKDIDRYAKRRWKQRQKAKKEAAANGGQRLS
jgi:hypothetical protein